MSLCIWTSAHLNLPEHRREHLQPWRRCGWLVLGLVAPEIVAWNAWEQRRAVKKLTADMREVSERRFNQPRRRPAGWKKPYVERIPEFRLPSAPWLKELWHRFRIGLLLSPGELNDTISAPCFDTLDQSDPLTSWTDLHSWYALMGGFVFDTSHLEEPILPERRQRLVLTSEGLIRLVENWPHLLPIITVADIRDKSKSDSLAKFLTCWQAVWFCVQCVCRLAQGLSISLLELNVLGHCICAFAIYAIWWNKPKDVTEPTKLVGSDSSKVAALLWSASSVGQVQPYSSYEHRKVLFTNVVKLETRSERYPRGASLKYVWLPVYRTEDCWYFPSNLPVAVRPIEEVKYPARLRCGNVDWSFVPTSHLAKLPDGRLSVLKTEFHQNFSVRIDRSTVRKLELLSELEGMQRLLHAMFEAAIVESEGEFRPNPPSFVAFCYRDWCLSRANLSVEQGGIYAMALATGLYGGLHALAWDALSRTITERLLGRAASLTIGLIAPAYTLRGSSHTRCASFTVCETSCRHF